MKRATIAVLVLSCIFLNGCGGKSEEAKAVIKQIDSIGNVTYESELAIGLAEEAYVGLNTEQRKEVTNFRKLVAARKEMDKLVEEHPVPFADITFGMSEEELIKVMGQPDDSYENDAYGYTLQYDNKEYEGYSGTIKCNIEDTGMTRAWFVLNEYSDEIFNHFNDLYTQKYGEPNIILGNFSKRWDKKGVSVDFSATEILGGIVSIVFISPELITKSASEIQVELDQYSSELAEDFDDRLVSRNDRSTGKQGLLNSTDSDEIDTDDTMKTDDDSYVDIASLGDFEIDYEIVPTEQHDFRNSNWGDSFETVQKAEKAKSVAVGKRVNLGYMTTIAGKESYLMYVFDKDGNLAEGFIFTTEKGRKGMSEDDFVEYYEGLYKSVAAKYGSPNYIQPDDGKEYVTDAGVPIFKDAVWQIGKTKIRLLLMDPKDSTGIVLRYTDVTAQSTIQPLDGANEEGTN